MIYVLSILGYIIIGIFLYVAIMFRFGTPEGCGSGCSSTEQDFEELINHIKYGCKHPTPEQREETDRYIKARDEHYEWLAQQKTVHVKSFYRRRPKRK